MVDPHPHPPGGGAGAAAAAPSASPDSAAAAIAAELDTAVENATPTWARAPPVESVVFAWGAAEDGQLGFEVSGRGGGGPGAVAAGAGGGGRPVLR